MRDFRKYKVWELGHEVTLVIYELTASFPDSERFGLTNQLRRASSSIPANIAEGCGRESDKDFKRFLYIANGSASEVEYFLILSTGLGYINKNDSEMITEKVSVLRRSLNKLISSIST
ncbi:four helix bundle protein [Marinoscillum sp. 108]|uniref:four helix bundle protein n=1 Tax=Marinoscillum sp. 108 TaxID=2653151 RepID=UPI0012F3BFE6|nr:four helix bundle protein [Marinoscillum sp. 108]VXD10617.1 Four helix bundle protein [Marinoscillum sp. 108]